MWYISNHELSISIYYNLQLVNNLNSLQVGSHHRCQGAPFMYSDMVCWLIYSGDNYIRINKSKEIETSVKQELFAFCKARIFLRKKNFWPYSSRGLYLLFTVYETVLQRFSYYRPYVCRTPSGRKICSHVFISQTLHLHILQVKRQQQ